ncbi:hypothetical protein [Candidatus Rhabdochlamydia sp. T3358]|uniref:hypothetical protein n=1 Tax=Candidatus Rhabdochlamydia sp. T3358 TaxID=2099795 RepID=UPI0010B7DA60|nr:hypothetical protein [Candidatus Rhabdochlamydia sp. T3358]VHO02145.1 Putative GTP cyclohydrolase 1 type 2 [Candidatus Rhabdochlamydia sp. T3358]
MKVWAKLVIFAPESHADQIRTAAAKVGAGKIGKYSDCSFSVKGTARFLPKKGSEPWTGKENQLEEVIEERIEMLCEEIYIEQVLKEISRVHPYEEPAIDIYPVYQRGFFT